MGTPPPPFCKIGKRKNLAPDRKARHLESIGCGYVPAAFGFNKSSGGVRKRASPPRKVQGTIFLQWEGGRQEVYLVCGEDFAMGLASSKFPQPSKPNTEAQRRGGADSGAKRGNTRLQPGEKSRIKWRASALA
jgi:hypothetical protein